MANYWGIHGLWRDGAETMLTHKVVSFGGVWRSHLPASERRILPDASDLIRKGTLRKELERIVADDERTAVERSAYIGQWVSRIECFVCEMKNGDKIVLPTTRKDNTFLIGIVIGDYRFAPSFEWHKHVRPVKWVTQVKRQGLQKRTLRLISQAPTFFGIRNPNSELAAILERTT